MEPRSRGLALCGCAALATLGFGTCRVVAPLVRDERGRLGVASLGLELVLASIAFAGGAASSLPLRDRLGLGAGHLGRSALLALVVGALALSHALDALAELSGLRQHSTLADLDGLLTGASGAGLWLALLGLGVAPGIGEELLCRGLVQRGLERRVGSALAVGVAALVFGALHLDPLHAGLAAVLGIYLGTTAVLAGSIRAPILCHVANNVVAVAVAALLPEPLRPGLIGVLVGLPLAGLCLWTAFRLAGPRAPPGLQPQAETDDL